MAKDKCCKEWEAILIGRIVVLAQGGMEVLRLTPTNELARAFGNGECRVSAWSIPAARPGHGAGSGAAVQDPCAYVAPDCPWLASDCGEVAWPTVSEQS